MIVLVDNYDSFSYNLYQLVGSVRPDIRVVRNDALTVEELAALKPDGIILSPGPGHPKDAGICEELVRKLSGMVPILGVCLGHQAICEAFGGSIVHAPETMHGKSSVVLFEGDCPLFRGLRFPCTVGRYHSLEADAHSLPSCLHVVAQNEYGEIMAVEHLEHPTFGLQFHPESILTPDGMDMISNFCKVIDNFK